jgi:hypothetical protein
MRIINHPLQSAKCVVRGTMLFMVNIRIFPRGPMVYNTLKHACAPSGSIGIWFFDIWITVTTRVTRRLEKMAQFLKSSQNFGQYKVMPKYLHQTTLKPQNGYNQPCFETANLVKNVKYLRKHKVAKKFSFLWATSSFQKIITSFQK